MLSQSILRGSLSLSLGCYFVANKNDRWERALHQRYRRHGDFRRALRALNTHAQSSDSTISSPVERDTHIVRMVKNALNQQQIERTSTACTTTTTIHNELNAMECTASVRDREDLVCRLAGLQQQYKSFAVALASSREAAARDALLSTFYDKPFTHITDDEDWHALNTRYLYWTSFLGALTGTMLFVSGGRKCAKSALVKLCAPRTSPVR